MVFKKRLILFFLILTIGTVFVLGFEFGKYREAKIQTARFEELGKVDLSTFWKVWEELHEKFLDRKNLDTQELIYGAISGMTRAVGDSYTIFLTPEETEKFEESMKGEFEGVGMEIGIKENQITVISPLPDTPAKEAGVLPGDKILKIDDKDTSSISIDEAVSLIRGPKGTAVTLTIFRESWEKPEDIKLIRSIIKIPTLEITEISPDICHLEIYQFNRPLSDDFSKEVSKILKSPAKKIILDLRNNSGGYLDVVEKISGFFLKTGDTILMEDYGEGKERDIRKARGKGELSEYPIVVLINQGSASGAEILAGALRDNRDVLLIGEDSFGKGSVQEALTLEDNSLLKITVAKWLTPKGNFISEVGLKPDIEIEMTEEDFTQGRDLQLDKAVEIIREM